MIIFNDKDNSFARCVSDERVLQGNLVGLSTFLSIATILWIYYLFIYLSIYNAQTYVLWYT